MANITRLVGKDLLFKLPATDYKAEIISCEATAKAKGNDATTFGDLAAGTLYDWALKIKAVQSISSESFMRFLLGSAGQHVAFEFAPDGSSVATPDTPHFTGTVVIAPPPTIGGAADPSKTFVFEVTLEVDAGTWTINTGV